MNNASKQSLQTNTCKVSHASAKSTFPTLQDGVHVVITEEADGLGAQDYCEMRAAQLSALLTLISGEGHENFTVYSDDVQDNVKWLARSLADEIMHLIPIVANEAKQRSKSGGKAVKSTREIGVAK